MNNKIQAKDLINVGLFTVIYFVLGCCVAIPIGMVPVFLPILGTLWVILTGIPFMLFLTRVKTFGMVTLMAVLSGLLMGLTGMGFFGVPCGLVFVMPMWSFILVAASIFVFAIVGGLIGKTLLKKHFKKAGIA